MNDSRRGRGFLCHGYPAQDTVGGNASDAHFLCRWRTGLRFCCRRPIHVTPVRALVFVILTPSKSSAQTARVPNAISFDGLKIDRPAVPEIEHYRGFLRGLKQSRYS